MSNPTRVRCSECFAIFDFKPEVRTKEHMKKINNGTIGVLCPDCEGKMAAEKELVLELEQNSPGTSNASPLTKHLKTTNACSDMVVRPNHYQLWPDTETLDVIKSMLTHEEFLGYCKGNILKYRLREKGNRKQDMAKAARHKHYIEEAINEKQ